MEYRIGDDIETLRPDLLSAMKGFVAYVEGVTGMPIGERYFDKIVKNFADKIMHAYSEVGGDDDRDGDFFGLSSFLELPVSGQIATVLSDFSLPNDEASCETEKDAAYMIRRYIESLLGDFVSGPKVVATNDSRGVKYAVRGPIEVEIGKQDGSWRQELFDDLVQHGVDNPTQIVQEFDKLKVKGFNYQHAFLIKYLGEHRALEMMNKYPIRANIGNSYPFVEPPKEVVGYMAEHLIKQNLRFSGLVDGVKSLCEGLGIDKGLTQRVVCVAERIVEAVGGYDKAELVLDELLPYSPVYGIKGLVEKILTGMDERGLMVEGENKNDFIRRLLLGNGSSELIRIIFDVLTEKSDEVVYFGDAQYSLYGAEASRRGVTERRIPVKDNDVSPDVIAESLNPRTRLLVINSPNNPTGAYYDVNIIDSIEEAIQRSGNRQIVIVFDEAYRRMVYEKAHVDIAQYVNQKYPNQIFVTCSSASKEASLLGLRGSFAYFGGPMQNMEFLDQIYVARATGLCANTIGQLGLMAAMATGKIVDIEKLKHRAEVLVKNLKTVPGLENVSMPDGGLYVFADVAKLKKAVGIRSSSELAERLAMDIHVSLVPGDGFGETVGNNDRVRFVTFLPDSTNLEIARRLKNWVIHNRVK
ncbi:MAG: aspartate aminotransferase, aspartate aminotransferase [Candidatus Peregrinibacteria bacterium GW2011_GWF2_38_29]|nr:MAG: aspartate aminotransferase, aspartate aminotransferase [Candidatus Peregrinibacteria bacterium GW2011_GWF2_38_29]HBB02203.1 hypothetical protein [Candidatus Peregrinibacteria bacterium]